MLCTFLTQLQSHPIILASPRDERIIKNLRSVFKRQRKTYKDWSQQNNQQHRKDSAIGILSCRNSVHEEKDITWTAKVRRSIKRSISNNCQPDATALASTCSLPTVNNADNTCNDANCTNQTRNQKSNDRFFSHRVSSYVLPEPVYRSVILKYRSEIIAQQFCLIEQGMLQKVTWDELVELRWRKRSSKRQSFVIDLATLEKENEYDIGVERLIGFFNMVLHPNKSCAMYIKHLSIVDLSMGCF